jgi:hypothetical protein
MDVWIARRLKAWVITQVSFLYLRHTLNSGGLGRSTFWGGGKCWEGAYYADGYAPGGPYVRSSSQELTSFGANQKEPPSDVFSADDSLAPRGKEKDTVYWFLEMWARTASIIVG